MSSCLRANNWLRFVIWNPDSSANLLPVQGSCDFAVVSQICMRTVPEVSGNHNGIDSLPSPPGTLIAAPMELSVVEPADGDGESVADFPPHRPLLSELDVM